MTERSTSRRRDFDSAGQLMQASCNTACRAFADHSDLLGNTAFQHPFYADYVMSSSSGAKTSSIRQRREDRPCS